jgi:hypothetical protein
MSAARMGCVLVHTTVQCMRGSSEKKAPSATPSLRHPLPPPPPSPILLSGTGVDRVGSMPPGVRQLPRGLGQLAAVHSVHAVPVLLWRQAGAARPPAAHHSGVAPAPALACWSPLSSTLLSLISVLYLPPPPRHAPFPGAHVRAPHCEWLRPCVRLPRCSSCTFPRLLPSPSPPFHSLPAPLCTGALNRHHRTLERHWQLYGRCPSVREGGQ